MKKLVFAVAAFIVSSSFAFSQGMIFDQEDFSKRQKFGVLRGTLPVTASLKEYTPMLYPQVGSTCVGHSFANARTILLAKSLKWTDKQKITGLSFSPYFIYYRNKSAADVNCDQGLNIELAAADVLNNGFAPIVDVEYPNYYPFTKDALCVSGGGTSYPPSMSEDLANAARFKINNIYAVQSVKELKTVLSKGMPVVLGMFVPESFYKATGEVWNPMPTDKRDPSSGHAILAVGYDDNKYGGAIELMNSWGDGWANKGFIWVKYADYEKWFLGGYAFYAADNPRLNTAINNAFTPEDTQTKPVSGPMKVSRDHGKTTVDFDNAKFVEAFKSDK